MRTMRQKSKKRNSKREAQKSHLKRRLWERFALEYTPEIEQLWVRHIQQGRARLVDKQSLRVSVWEVPLPLRSLPYGHPYTVGCVNEDLAEHVHVVYDSNRKSIVTVLYPDGAKI